MHHSLTLQGTWDLRTDISEMRWWSLCTATVAGGLPTVLVKSAQTLRPEDIMSPIMHKKQHRGHNVQPGGQAIDLAHISSWMIKPCGCHHPEMPTGIAWDLTLQDQTICPFEGKGRCILHPILAAASGDLGDKCWCTEMETMSLRRRKRERQHEKKQK